MTEDLLSIENIGIGPTGLKRLNDMGYHSALDLVVHNPRWLMDATGLNRAPAEKVFKTLLANLHKAKLIDPVHQTASEILKSKKTVKRLRLGNKDFDEFLSTGFVCGDLNEIHGTSGAGKTQICHILAVQALCTEKAGGLDTTTGKGIVLYLDTEGAVSPERLLSFARARKMDEKIIDRIVVIRITNYSQLIVTIQNLATMLDDIGDVKTVILDSLSSHFRKDLPGQSNSNLRSVALNEIMSLLQSIAIFHKIPVIFTNQIYNPQDQYKDNMQVFGGNLVAHPPTLRLRLEKLAKNRKATIYKSPSMPQKEFMYEITDAGIAKKK